MTKEATKVPPELGKLSVSGSIPKEVLDVIDREALLGWRTRGAQVAKILTEWTESHPSKPL
jgi:hypothetical protein